MENDTKIPEGAKPDFAALKDVRVGGELFTPIQPPQKAFALTHMAFLVLKGGPQSSVEQTWISACLGTAVGGLFSALGLFSSCTYTQSNGQPNWIAIIVTAATAVLVISSLIVAAVCYARIRQSSENAAYKALIDQVEKHFQASESAK